MPDQGPPERPAAAPASTPTTQAPSRTQIVETQGKRHPAHWGVCVGDFFRTPTFYRIDWLIMLSFLVTFIAARVMVLTIMMGWAPAFLFLHVKGTHVHHLNYGIILLSLVGAYLLLGRPKGTTLAVTALVYGVGLGLTFDEFGMWLHLGGGYWQRTSFDGVMVILGCLGLIASGPALRHYRAHHWLSAIAVGLAVMLFAGTLYFSYHIIGPRIAPSLHELEERGPQ